MNRALYAIGLALLVGGGSLLGYGLFSGGGDTETATPIAYTETQPCTGCPVNLDSAEVQARQGSTLFVFGGEWPAAAADIPGDLRLEANDLAVTLHPTEQGFEIADGSLGPEEIAVGLVEGRLLIDLVDGAVSPPIRFAFGVVEGNEFTARMPRSGELVWSGSGAPRLPAEEPVEEPAEEPVAEPETPEEFAEALAVAFREGDDAFLLERLHPAVIDLYGEGQCANHVAGLQNPTQEFEVRRVSDLEPYDYAPDDASVSIPEAYTVLVDSTSEGQQQRQELHFAPEGDLLTWFTDCGRPAA